jgi:hypothetical protein
MGPQFVAAQVLSGTTTILGEAHSYTLDLLGSNDKTLPGDHETQNLFP